MSMLSKFAVFSVVALLGVASQSADAVGFGRSSHTTLLGQTLDLVVPVTADGTEQLTSECVSAEVLVGDTRVAPSAVRSRLEWLADSGARVLRVSSSVRIDEPVVTVTVTAGCPARLTRQFVLFIDPPPLTAPGPVGVAAPPTPETALAAPVGVSGAAARVSSADSQAAVARDASVVRRPWASTKPTPSPSARSLAPSGVVGSDEVPVVRKSSKAKPARASKRAPRLQLEAAARPLAAEAAAAAMAELMASAASAAAAAASEAQATTQRQLEALQALQKQMESVKAQADAANKNIAQMQRVLRESQESSNGWLLVASALAAAVVALLAWVVWLLKQRASVAQAAPWWSPEPPKATASVAPDVAQVERAGDGLPSELELPFRESVHDTSFSVLTGSQATESFAYEPAKHALVTPTEQDVAPFLTADELIDLGQQADFFVALGQDDSAIGLLEGQLPMVGGGGAWPYLQLLEIHRRRDDRAAFDRVCERFEQRFGVLPVDWRVGSATGKSLEAYDGVIKRIEGVWAEPQEAARLIETLMIRGDSNVQCFDLAAMADLQSLYLLAKSLLEPAQLGIDSVDLLLPFDLEIDEIGAFVETRCADPKASPAADSTIDFTLDLLPPADDSSPPK